MVEKQQYWPDAKFSTTSPRVDGLIELTFGEGYTFFADKLRLARRSQELATAELTAAGYDATVDMGLERAVAAQRLQDAAHAVGGPLVNRMVG